MSALLRGVDVSAMQSTLDAATWRALRAAGCAFAIMRAFVGNETWTDATAAPNVQHAADEGIAVGVYGFAYPLRTIDPKRQVEDWIGRLEKVRGATSLDVPFALDLEWPPREEWKVPADGTKILVYPWRDKWKIDGPFIRDWGLTALERLRELTGRIPLVYSFRYFLDCVGASSAPDFAAYPLWLADYTYRGRVPTQAEAEATKVPGPWTEIAIIQHDGDGGLTLPNGRDADFNVLIRGAETLDAWRADSAPAETIPEVDPEAARLEVMDGIVDAEVAAYRRDRIDVAA